MIPLIEAEIYHATFIRATPDQVYDAFATAKGLDGWFTVGSRVDARAGGEIVFRWQDWSPEKITAEARCPVQVAERGKQLIFQWHGDNRTYFTTVTLDFEPMDGGTVVRVRESGYWNTPTGIKGMLNCATGWGEALTLVKFYVEHGLSVK